MTIELDWLRIISDDEYLGCTRTGNWFLD